MNTLKIILKREKNQHERVVFQLQYLYSP